MSARWVDISEWQTSFDFAAAKKAGVEGVIIRATYGKDSIDKLFAAHVAGARKAGLKIGFYHFAYPNANHPADEATHFLTVVKPLIENHDFVALDFETAPMTEGWALTWLRQVEATLLRKPLFYSYLSAIQSAHYSTKMANYPLWLADYTGTQPAPPAPWTKIAIWQRADHDGVPGWKVDADNVNVVPASVYKQRQLIGWTVSYVGRDKQRHTRNVKHPAIWCMRHPLVFRRGRVVLSRRFA